MNKRAPLYFVRHFKRHSVSVAMPPLELFAMGPVQFSRPRGVTENWFTELGFG